MKLFKQIRAVFAERNIEPSDSLEEHFDMLHELLRQYCMAYGQGVSSLDEDDLKDIYHETTEHLLQRFQEHDIDIKEIHMENSGPVMETFVSAFIFIFQRRMVERVKRRNQGIEWALELLEDFARQGIEEPDMTEIAGLENKLRPILEKENFSKTEKLFLEFIFSKINGSLIKGEGSIETGITQTKDRLSKQLEKNRQELAQILE